MLAEIDRAAVRSGSSPGGAPHERFAPSVFPLFPEASATPRLFVIAVGAAEGLDGR